MKKSTWKAENRTDFVDWFSPFNLDHIRAYNEWTKTGFFPKSFVPKTVVVYNDFSSHIDRKIAGEWIRHLLSFDTKYDDTKNPQRKGERK